LPRWRRRTLFDQQITRWLAAHRSQALTLALLWVSRLHATVPVSFATMIVAIWLIQRGDWRWLAALIAAVPAGMLLDVGLKHLFQRVLDEPLVSLTSYSFPSGHVTGSTLFYGFVCALLFVHTRSPSWCWLAAAASLLLVAAVAFRRMYLGAHYLSDVLGAFTLAVAWLAFSLSAVHGRLNRNMFGRRALDEADDIKNKETHNGQ